jgi:Tfp pilus assembly protein PilX
LWDLTATRHKPARTSISCTGANANTLAFCLDAPCSANKGAVSCKCQLSPASDYIVLTSSCPTGDKGLHAACAQIWSSASQAELMSGYSPLAPFYGRPPKIAYWPAISPARPAKN